MKTTFASFAIVLILLTGTPSSFGQDETSTDVHQYRSLRSESPIKVDGLLDEPAWSEATPIPLNYEWFPGDQTEPPVGTDAFVTYDDDYFYIAFKAYDPDPSSVRAHLMDRDSINTFVQDDHITFMIDTFNDERRAFQFRVNPLGVQADAIFSQVEFVEDFSWDIIWDSAGKITDFGYVVEVAIPLNQLRFPKTSGKQTWGIELGRSYPRAIRHRIAANRRDRNNNCLLCQIDKFTGFEGLEPGRNIELDPTLTANRTDTREDFPDGAMGSGDADFEAGITARWGITPSLTLNGTINPDFSQVEADAVQLDVNERFALFFEEKRPFFLEGVDFFSTPIDAVFTRTVVSPEWGVKLSGKVGSNAGGVFLTRDEVNSFVIPSNQRSQQAFLNESVDAGVVRYRRDIGANSTIGVLYAGREGTNYHNRVSGIDGFVRLSRTDELRFQYLRSDTLYPQQIADDYDQPEEGFSDDAILVEYDHQSQNWRWSLEWEDLGPGFRADSGFVPRVDIKRSDADLSRIFRGDRDDWYTQMNIGVGYERVEDHNGQLTDEEYDAFYLYQGPMQSVAQVGVSVEKEFYFDTLYEDLSGWFAYFEIQPGAVGKFSLFAQGGETIDYSNNQPADEFVVQPRLELKLGRHVNAQFFHIFQDLKVADGDLSTANISELRLVYNFSTRLFVRGIFQYRNVDYSPENFGFPIQSNTERFFSQLLFSYKVNPQTVVFVGYSDNYRGYEDDHHRVDLTQSDRTIFVKLGYAWIL
ncbi:MAG: carbohydrate binding family 9 domain-containing protein [bacterium]|nr:carbohydrate binding family 9 domain-containing protein [bacterium]